MDRIALLAGVVALACGSAEEPLAGLGARDDGGSESGGSASSAGGSAAATGGATDMPAGGRAPVETDAGAGGSAVAPSGGSGGGTGPECGLGETRACLGPGACSGAQECREDRSGFGACDCGEGSGGSPGAGGASSGGVGSGGAPSAGGEQGGATGGSGSGGTSGAWYEGPTPAACVPTWDSGAFGPNTDGQEGGCLFVADVPSELRADFGRSTCPADHHCMPCVRFTTTRTGACPP
jgi:hypothetical protein